MPGAGPVLGKLQQSQGSEARNNQPSRRQAGASRDKWFEPLRSLSMLPAVNPRSGRGREIRRTSRYNQASFRATNDTANDNLAPPRARTLDQWLLLRARGALAAPYSRLLIRLR